MRTIKYKVYIKELNNIFDVNTMTFLDEWVRVFVKWDDTRNYLIDWINVVLLEWTWKNDRNWKNIFYWDIVSLEHPSWKVVVWRILFSKIHNLYLISDTIYKLSSNAKHSKVIWNRFLNPKLLQNEEN